MPAAQAAVLHFDGQTFALPANMEQPIVWEDCSGPVKFSTDFHSICMLGAKAYISLDWSWDIQFFRGNAILNAHEDDQMVSPIAFQNLKDVLAMKKPASDFYTEEGLLKDIKNPLFEVTPYQYGYDFHHVRDVEPLTFGDALIGYMFTPLSFGGDFPPAYTQRVGVLYNRETDVLMVVKLALPAQMFDTLYTYIMDNGKKDAAGEFDYDYYSQSRSALVGLLGAHFDMEAQSANIEEVYGNMTEALVSITTEEPHTDFPDVPFDHPLYDAMGIAKARYFVSGYPDGTMRPDAQINRAEFLKILIEASTDESLLGQAADCFSDVKKSAWFASYVCYAKNKGIVGGYPDGRFAPEQTINLAEALKIVAEAYNLEGESTGGEWYNKYMQIARDMGLLLRLNKMPWDLLTRAEMTELIARMQMR